MYVTNTDYCPGLITECLPLLVGDLNLRKFLIEKKRHVRKYS